MELDCGIRQGRISAWLNDELALACDGGFWVYHAGENTCRIALAPLDNRVLGKLNLERTLVTIDGDSEAIDAFYRLFTLRFISAGG